jgi:uncharacterized protein (TIGR03382 family)
MYSSILLSLTPPAHACGGFACDPGPVPILQEAEQIVFGLDEERNEVEMHVKITYAGADNDFAWIVPVPQAPELFLTTASLFDQIQLATQPLFTRQVVQDGNCRTPEVRNADTGDIDMEYDSTGGSYDESSDYDVEVVAEELVGAYETVTLAADSAEDLLGYLQSEGYALPDSFEDVLAPYVSDGAYFVALKLSTLHSGGDLAPLALRYPASKGMVPVQLTSISATPDMRMEAYVFSDGRAVPESYLHVRINDAAVDWWNNGENYLDVISEAANEAGGRAFATDYHGSSDIVGLLSSGYTEEPLREASDANAWTWALARQLPVVPPELFPALEQALDLSPGDGALYWSCADCVEVTDFDADTATDVIVERVLEPMRAAQSLLDRHPYLSRMTSAMSAVEMTVDPVFVVNHDLAGEPVASLRQMTETVKCKGLFGEDPDEADREIALQDGRVIGLPSAAWLREQGMTELEYLAEHADINAAIIEQMGAEGPPVVLVDHSAALAELARLSLRGCGCDTSGGVGATLGLALALGAASLRRRAATR